MWATTSRQSRYASGGRNSTIDGSRWAGVTSTSLLSDTSLSMTAHGCGSPRAPDGASTSGSSHLASEVTGGGSVPVPGEPTPPSHHRHHRPASPPGSVSERAATAGCGACVLRSRRHADGNRPRAARGRSRRRPAGPYRRCRQRSHRPGEPSRRDHDHRARCRTATRRPRGAKRPHRDRTMAGTEFTHLMAAGASPRTHPVLSSSA
jgi:hypothetical protein